jgi:hypothetical protein
LQEAAVPIGLYRYHTDRDGAVICVEYEEGKFLPLKESLYERHRYQPTLEELPTQEEYEAKKNKDAHRT